MNKKKLSHHSEKQGDVIKKPDHCLFHGKPVIWIIYSCEDVI